MTSQSSAIDFLRNEFCAAFSSVFEQTAGLSFDLQQSDKPQPAQSEALGYMLEFRGSINGNLFVQVELQSAAILAATLMQEPTTEGVTYLPEHEDALYEIVSQTAGLMATSLRTRFGSAEIVVDRKPANSADSPTTLILEPTDPASSVLIELRPDLVLFSSLTASLSAPSQPSPSAQVDSTPASPQDTNSERQNLRLIMDVELDLTLRFGQRTLMLSEVADLTTGSVVELDRIVDDPVELLLGDRVIARGEVVIVDGNYGLRVTELASIDHNSLLSA